MKSPLIALLVCCLFSLLWSPSDVHSQTPAAPPQVSQAFILSVQQAKAMCPAMFIVGTKANTRAREINTWWQTNEPALYAAETKWLTLAKILLIELTPAEARAGVPAQPSAPSSGGWTTVQQPNGHIAGWKALPDNHTILSTDGRVVHYEVDSHGTVIILPH